MKLKILLLFIVITLCPATLWARGEEPVRNIILMIGDGMGLSQTGALMIESGYKPLNIERATNIGICKTYSANNRVTDSASAGTAIATGHKTNNKYIGITPDGESHQNLIEIAKSHGLRSGLVTTSHLADATPACFVAHTDSRDNIKTITAAYATAEIDILAGGGRLLFENSLNGRNIIKELTSKGYKYVTTTEDFLHTKSLPILALFADKHMPFADIRGEEHLAMATAHTLNLLSASKKGFFVMIEGSHIDRACHKNDAGIMLAEMRDFDKAVGVAFDFADTHPGTLVIVVADHETGGLTMISGDNDFTTADSGITYEYSTTGHSGIPIILYAYGAEAARFAGVMENTEIFHRIKVLLESKK